MCVCVCVDIYVLIRIKWNGRCTVYTGTHRYFATLRFFFRESHFTMDQLSIHYFHSSQYAYIIGIQNSRWHTSTNECAQRALCISIIYIQYYICTPIIYLWCCVYERCSIRLQAMEMLKIERSHWMKTKQIAKCATTAIMAMATKAQAISETTTTTTITTTTNK